VKTGGVELPQAGLWGKKTRIGVGGSEKEEGTECINSQSGGWRKG